MEEILRLIDAYWKFDEMQQPISSWHDKQDLLEAVSQVKLCSIPNVSGSLLLQVKELFAKLTDDERMEIMSDYCKYCGQNEEELGKCYCAPCYDE